MIAFFRRNQVLLSSCFCLLFSTYILGAASTGRLQTDPVGPLLLEAVRPLQRGLQATVVALWKLQDSYQAFTGLWRGNVELKRRIMELEAERNRLLEAEATNRRLQELLDLKTQVAGQSVTAAVIGNSASTWFQSLTINKGTKDGIRKGMAVISPVGIVGQLVTVAPRSSKVLLITDHNSGVDVIVQRSRARGIVSGSLGNAPVLKYVSRNDEIREGDRLVTSGLDGIFPKGLLVGTVGMVRKETSGLFQHVEVSLAVNPSRIEEVLVVSAEPTPLSD
ncbi:MAG: rod shape-determining protein MreC [Candidatus Binatia bacterium]